MKHVSENSAKKQDNKLLNNSIADHIIKHHPWVKWDLVEECLEDPSLDEVKRLKILELRRGGK